MKKRNLLPVIGVPLIAMSGVAIAQDKVRPNIVVIMADDLGTCELSCYGGRNLKTTNIDKLAEEGMLMTNNYASCTMSVPIRASLYTGLYPAKHGSYQNHKTSYSDIKSVTSYMPEAGYRVGRTGKQHTTPTSVFDFEEIPGFEANCVSSTANYTVDGITEFITRNDKPFCLYVCSIHPHVPWTWGNSEEFNPDKVVLPPNCVDNKETRELFCKYLAEVRSLDNEVGSVLEVLRKTGKLDNTLVVFLGEQGPQMPFGKWTCWRYGQNSACIARFPQRIKANSISDALIQYEDILPTLIDFADGDPLIGIDGNSFLPVLYGKEKSHRDWAYGIHNNIPEGGAYPIRSIQDKRYKLILNLTPDAKYFEKHMMDVENRKQVWANWLESAETDKKADFLVNKFVNRPSIEFYDLKKDPWELNNLAESKKYASKIAEMKSALEKWMIEQGDKGAAMDVVF